MNFRTEYLVGALFGALLVYGFYKFSPSLKKRLSQISSLIKNYWFISVIILLVSSLMNFVNYKYSLVTERDFFENIINFYSGLFFAMFTGYTAFKQFQSNRYDKIKKDASEYFSSGEKYFNKARRLFEEAYLINSRDDLLLNEYAELMMILGKWHLLKKLVQDLNKVKNGDYIKIEIFYFKIGEQLIKEHIKEAKEEIKKMLRFIKKNSAALKNFS